MRRLIDLIGLIREGSRGNKTTSGCLVPRSTNATNGASEQGESFRILALSEISSDGPVSTDSPGNNLAVAEENEMYTVRWN